MALSKQGVDLEVGRVLLKLVPFLTALREANSGTTTDVVVRDGHLLRAFLCLRACATAFEASLRLMCVDGCHLKTGCGVVLLVASAVDGNGNAFPVAIAVTEGESADSWSWFLTLLRSALRIGDGEGVTIISDREKGIERGWPTFFRRRTTPSAFFTLKRTSSVGSRRT